MKRPFLELAGDVLSSWSQVEEILELITFLLLCKSIVDLRTSFFSCPLLDSQTSCKKRMENELCITVSSRVFCTAYTQYSFPKTRIIHITDCACELIWNYYWQNKQLTREQSESVKSFNDQTASFFSTME